MKTKQRLSALVPISSPGRVLFQSSFICACLLLMIFGFTLERIEPLPVDRSEPKFSTMNSYSWMKELATRFPFRVPWKDNHSKSAIWIKSELVKLGYQPQTQLFSEVIAGRQYTDLQNIWVEKKGKTHPDELILAVAHYDVSEMTEEGAMDDASGIGVVLELARIFSKEEPNRTLIFLFTDSEEYGAFWGARSFAKFFDRTNQIVAVENFDFVSPETQTKILTLCDGLKKGYTPLWLREIALNSIRSLNQVQAVDLAGIEEFVERALQIPAADHGAFLAAGVPAFNWVGQTDHFAHIMKHYHHTVHDRATAMQPESMGTYGRAGERVMRTIDQLPRLPDDLKEMSYIKISQDFFIPGWAALLIHILCFIPFLIYSTLRVLQVYAIYSGERITKVVKNELKAAGILLGSFLLGYGVLLLLPAFQVITLYEIFPATQKSTLLYNPNFIAILSVILAICIVYWTIRKMFSETDDGKQYPEIRQSVHGAILTAVIFLAFLKNSYLAVLLLLPPAYFWMGMRVNKRKEDRLLNGLLILAGTISFLAICVVMGTVFHVGVFYWYVFLAAAYGLISAYSVVLFFMALTVMMRLLKSFVF